MMKNLLVAAMVATASLSIVGCAQLKELTAPRVDDATLGTNVKAALAADAEVSPLKITVQSTAGTVRLKGEVKNMATRRKIEDIVRKVQGVKGVDNQLVITG